jgi:hypothetical protein
MVACRVVASRRLKQSTCDAFKMEIASRDMALGATGHRMNHRILRKGL